MSPFYITLPPMFHADISPLAAGLPPSILAAAAGRAARLAGISVTDLLDVDAAHEKADIITATLEKVQAQYSRKKEASRDRRSAARKVAPVVQSVAEPSVAVLSVAEPVAVASAAMGISHISIVGAEPEPLPPPPTPSPPPSPPAKAPPRPLGGKAPHTPPSTWKVGRAVSKKPPPAQEEESEEEESEEEESEEEESETESEEEDYEPPPPPARALSRTPSRPAAPKKAAPVISATRARWGL